MLGHKPTEMSNYNPYSQTTRPAPSRQQTVNRNQMLARGYYPVGDIPALVYNMVQVKYGPQLDANEDLMEGVPWAPIWVVVLWDRRDKKEGAFRFIDRLRECKSSEKHISALLTSELLLKKQQGDNERNKAIRACLARVR